MKKKRLTMTSLLPLNDRANALSFCTGTQANIEVHYCHLILQLFFSGCKDSGKSLRSFSRQSLIDIFLVLSNVFWKFCLVRPLK